MEMEDDAIVDALMFPYIKAFQQVVHLFANEKHLTRTRTRNAVGGDRTDPHRGRVWLVHESHALIVPAIDERTLDRLDISATPWLVIVEYNDHVTRVYSTHATYAEACAAFLARVA